MHRYRYDRCELLCYRLHLKPKPILANEVQFALHNKSTTEQYFPHWSDVHGSVQLKRGRVRPESFRSARNACNSARSFVVSFNFARTVSADRYGILIKIPPSSKNCLAKFNFAKSSASAPSYTKHFTALKLLDRMVLTNVCIYLRDVALSLNFFTKVWVVSPISAIRKCGPCSFAQVLLCMCVMWSLANPSQAWYPSATARKSI